MRSAALPALALLTLALAGTAVYAQKSGPGAERRSVEPRSTPSQPPAAARDTPRYTPRDTPRDTHRDTPRDTTPGAARGEGGSRRHKGPVHLEGPDEPHRIPRGMVHENRPRNLTPPSSSEVLVPPATPKVQLWPEYSDWKTRDIFAEIRYMARRGYIPVTFGGDAAEIVGSSYLPAGWRAYAFVVPGKEKLHVRLHHTNEGWFRLAMVDRWGQMRVGMLQNLIGTGNPEVSYSNPVDLANTVYVLVDDPGWMGTKDNPFTLKVDRSWDPAATKAPALPAVMGIWAQAKLEAKDAAPAQGETPKAPADAEAPKPPADAEASKAPAA